MNDMQYGLAYEVARQRVKELLREAEEARMAHEATRGQKAKVKARFTRPSVIEFAEWVMSRVNPGSLQNVR